MKSMLSIGCGGWSLGLLLGTAVVTSSVAAIPAFPGAEGAGAYGIGGRGGDVYYVTSLSDSGPGTLRDAVASAAGPRTILFKVSGTIDLQSDLLINHSFLTIAGQSAPGDGITLRYWTTSAQNAHDVIVRFIRFRPGDINCPLFQDDSFHVVYGTNVVVDHVSASWCVDEALSVSYSDNVTVQWSLITESLRSSCHDGGTHGDGSLLGHNGDVSFHHDLYADHDSRNPRMGDSMRLDFVNNVLYNWGFRAGCSGQDSPDNPDGTTNYVNWVANYMVAGPSTTTPTVAFLSGALNTRIFQATNRIDSNKNSAVDGSDTGWGMINGPYTPYATRFTLPTVTTESAVRAYARVLALAGASVVRDAVDVRVIGQVRTHTGALIDSQSQVGGWPALNSTRPPLDTDGDGMPDFWEVAAGLDPNTRDGNLDRNGDGYTELEDYLNWLAGPHSGVSRNGILDLDLRTFTGTSGASLTFTVANGTNGTVSLLANGYTARFLPTTDFMGFASFSFTATDPAVATSFGPNTVSLIVTGSNTPPVINPIPDRTITAGATLAASFVATDNDYPAQALTFSVPGAPAGATINPTNGTFTWRPAMAQAGTNFVPIVVTDSGSPSLSATQFYRVVVNRPASPAVQSAGITNGRISLLISGSYNPDYYVQATTNLANPAGWVTLLATNTPFLPIRWTDTGTVNLPQRFYRVLLGP